jgi:hypothetical protein
MATYNNPQHSPDTAPKSVEARIIEHWMQCIDTARNNEHYADLIAYPDLLHEPSVQVSERVPVPPAATSTVIDMAARNEVFQEQAQQAVVSEQERLIADARAQIRAA